MIFHVQVYGWGVRQMEIKGWGIWYAIGNTLTKQIRPIDLFQSDHIRLKTLLSKTIQ